MAGRADDSREGAEVDPLLAAVGARVRAARTAAGLSLVDAARGSGISKDYLWRLEQGRQAVTVKALAGVATALNTAMSDLLTGL